MVAMVALDCVAEAFASCGDDATDIAEITGG